MDEVFFQFSSNSDPQNTIPQDEILDFVPMGGSSSSSRGRQRRILSSEKRENNHDDDKKKSMHRDIERQRRQEMSTLCASLRTLLPLEYIKGKRAISDHMNGTVSYIKDLQKRIEELSAKRDELKKLSFDLTSSGFHRRTSSNEYSLRSSAVVRQSLDGVEAVVRSRHGAQASTLSRVLQLLLEEGLDVISCISTRIDGGLIHIIKLEVIGVRDVDLPYLQQKVNEEISSLNRT